MKKQIQILALLMLVAIMILSACGGKPTGTKNSAVPDTLQTIEGAAEDIIDFAPSGAWDKINADVTSIANAWKAYQRQAGKDAAPQSARDALSSALVKLQTASVAKDAVATMQAANDLSAAVIDLFDVYNPKIPADVGRLDVLERQVILDVAANNYDAAAASLAKVKSVWESVKPSVLESKGKDVAAQFETSITIQEEALTAKDGTTLTNEAKNGLEIVDALESLY